MNVTPHKVFSYFSPEEEFFFQYLPFSKAAFLFLRHILAKFGENRLVGLREVSPPIA